MPTLPTVALFLLAALGLLIIPGPSVLYVVARSVEHGKRAVLASMFCSVQRWANFSIEMRMSSVCSVISRDASTSRLG